MGRQITGTSIVYAFAYATFQGQTAIMKATYRVQGIQNLNPMDTDVLNTLDQMYPPHIRAFIANAANYASTCIQVYDAPNLYPMIGTEASAGVGLSGPIALPKQTCGVITKITDYAGGGGRGRMYAPFPAIDATELTGGSQPLARHTGLLGNIANAFMTVTPVNGAGGGSLQLVPVLRYSIKPGPTTHGYRDITGFRVRSKWGTQRKRGDYGRANSPPDIVFLA